VYDRAFPEFAEHCNVTGLLRHRQKADGREQRFPCQQQDETAFPAQPAKAPVLG
jgi:hypothetical protein